MVKEMLKIIVLDKFLDIQWMKVNIESVLSRNIPYSSNYGNIYYVSYTIFVV